MEYTEYLKDLGLSEHEAGVYLGLLKLGPSKASVITQHAGLQRTTAYPILKSLARQGFVSIAYKGVHKYFTAQQPAKLARSYERRLQNFLDIIPSLKTLEKQQAQALGLRFIETKEELERFYQDILAEYKNKTYRIIGSAPAWEGIDPEFFIQFRKDRAKANIKTRLLLSADSTVVSPSDPALLREVKYLPAGYNFKSTIDMYSDQILIVSPELTSLAVAIGIPAMVDVFQSVFDILWDTLP